jgi:DcaP outer membrane protein
MKEHLAKIFSLCVVFVFLAVSGMISQAAATDQDLEQLKATINQMQKTIEQQNKRIEELEKVKAAPAPVAAQPVQEAMPTMKVEGTPAPVAPRYTMSDQQEASPRLDDLTLDPKFQGFIPVPNTNVLIKLNAKPRVDMTWDNQNAGDDNRFITAKIPVEGDSNRGGGARFNMNAKGSQFRIDVRAPHVDGNPRFYFQNDFFASGSSDLNLRIQHIYGQIYNIIVGKTYGIFEDPDVWPDTVDYEGPNSMLFVRRELVRYQLALSKEWYLNFGIEKPIPQIDSSGYENVETVKRWPDVGVNARWERSGVGHIQLSSVIRDLRVRGDAIGKQSVLGWGVNASAGFDITKADAVQALLVYGEGIGGLGNDSGFENTDAAIDSSGDLKALEYYSAMIGFTHRWSDVWRSTVSYGYVYVDNEEGQSDSAYHTTQYASANIIWQLRKRLSVGLEGLYGVKETNDGHDGNVFRMQLGLLYSIFD